jgi:peptide/nickel transport system permease protein
MLTFLGKRLLATLPVLLVVAIAIFMIVRLTPGDPAAVIGGNSATNEDLDRIRVQLGLTRPLWEQFAIWGRGMCCTATWAISFFLQDEPVTELIGQRHGADALAGRR